jgi:hypothetical protein
LNAGGTEPLWRQLGGRTYARVLSALILDELAQRTPLTTAEQLRRLRRNLGRTLSRQTLAAWKRGEQAVPAEVLVIMAAIARVTLTDVSNAVAMRVVTDPEADQGFAAALRRYYTGTHVEFPAEELPG